MRVKHEYPFCAQAADDSAGGGLSEAGTDVSPGADSGGGDAGGQAPPAESPRNETVGDALRAAFEKAEAGEQDQSQQAPPVAEGNAGRDAQGRFLPKDRTAAQQAADANKVARQDGQPPAGGERRQPGPSALKPPSSWKTESRASWDKLPPAVQQEVIRREQEIGRALQESASARGMVQEFSGLLAPYAHNIQAAGMPASEMVKQLFDADNGLRHSTPLSKAQIVASIINSYGVDIQMLDDVLAGEKPRDDPQQRLLDQLRGEFQKQLQPMHNFLNSFQGRQQQMQENLRGEVASEIESMQDREHFDELREDMADLLERAARHRVAMTMEEAYNRALRLHPTLYESVARQNDQQRAQRAREAAQRARAAAISRPSGAPAGHGAPAAAPETVRDALVAAFDAHADS